MASPSSTAAGSPTPMELLRSRGYIALLILGAAVGVPVAIVAYFYLEAVSKAQRFFLTDLPHDLGFAGTPVWWPIPMVAVGGLLVGLSLRYLPGTGGHNPAEGFVAGPTVSARDMPGVAAASLATLAFGAVLGPEAPLVLIGSGLAVLIARLVKRDAPAKALVIVGAAGSFAAISTLLISPLAGAFLLLEAVGVGGSMVSVVLAPGLLAAGIGALIFVGLNHITGFGTFSLAVPNIPVLGTPTVGEFGWAIAIGLAAGVLGTAIRRLAFQIQPYVSRRTLLATPVAGLVVGGLAALFAAVTDKGPEQVLFSGQTALPPLIQQAGAWSVGELLLLVACKSLAYSVSLSSFRGGPTFPGMFIGAAGGLALSHLAGLPLTAGVGMGVGAMTVVMLGGLPLTAVLLTLLFLQAEAVNLISVVIVAVVVAWVTAARLSPWSRPRPPAATHGGRAADPSTADRHNP
ncbi:chloride channel protein [Asanoa ishikariensis]|uniref:chloride channel protein n=1 Tax=Asanoa ishikariensis TaxID=137265 RepID=UPI00194DFB45|nr:chloride channel protein [Asanoa ishikariensis]